MSMTWYAPPATSAMNVGCAVVAPESWAVLPAGLELIDQRYVTPAGATPQPLAPTAAESATVSLVKMPFDGAGVPFGSVET
jgi:hypothetical protein